MGTSALGSAALGHSVAASDDEHEEDSRNELTIVGKHEHDTGHEAGEHGKHSFELSTSEISAGLATLTFDNQTDHTHFVYTVRVNEAEAKLADYEGDTLREKYMNAVTSPFQDAWDPYYAGETDAEGFVENLGAALPDWYFSDELVPVGGPGLTSGGIASTTTLDLSEGTYFTECYVLDGDGRFHSANGMLDTFEVTDDTSEMEEPEPSLDVTVSSTRGIEFDEATVEPGEYTVEVTFEDNALYGHGLGHDVNLLRLDRPEDINVWLDYLDAGADGMYADRGALTSTGSDPGPAIFLGGVQDVFPSGTAYLNLTLEPGRYAWVAEVPDPLGKGMLVPFTVGDDSEEGNDSD